MSDKDLVVEFGSFQEVLDGFATHLSEEGVFFENGDVGSVGSEVPFEVRIRDGFCVLRGEGEIVQATDQGVFLRLVNLDPPSLKLLPKLLEHYRKRGVPLLELPPRQSVEAEPEFAEPALETPPAGLTLDDLEAEFLSDVDTEPVAADVPDETEATATPLLDAALLAVNGDVGDDRVDEPADSEAQAVSGLETDEDEPILIDPEELITETAEAAEDPADDIHLDELLTVESSEVLELAEATPLEDVQVDSGLPWLPVETEKSGRKGLWVVLLAILLGALLGVAFYFGYLRPRASQSWLPPEPPEVEARALPAKTSSVSATIEPAVISEAAVAGDRGGLPRESVLAERANGEPSPMAHDPPRESLTGVDRITWASEAGETVITFWADGLFAAEQVDDFRVAGGTPREVVRVRGVRRPFPQQRVELDGDHVRQIRIGLHEEVDGVALHFVADLVDGEVQISRTEAAGERLRVYFSKAG